MLIFRNKRTKKIYAGSVFYYSPPRRRYADGIWVPMLIPDWEENYQRGRRNLPEDKFEAIPVALVDLRTGATITWNQKEDTKT